MRLRYIYSACVVIETEDTKILCDPWFTPGIYDGAWVQYPILADPIRTIGPTDIIYISHIHPDHYDATFLRRYLATYPQARLLIGETAPNYLLNKMRLDGFTPQVAASYTHGTTECFILPNHGYEDDNIDTALVVRSGGISVVNMNDNPYDAAQIEQIIALLPGGRATAALLPYAGAGPYPQTYRMDEKTLAVKAEAKKQQFLGAFQKYVEALNPMRAIPFAGKYWLAGPLAALNASRGIADATEAANLFPERALVLADGGEASLDLQTLHASALRTAPYDAGAIAAHLQSLPFHGYDYEREIQPLPGHAVPLMPLLQAAYRNAFAKTLLADTYWLCIHCPGRAGAFVMNLAKDEGVKHLPSCEHLQPRSELTIDARYLFGLLSRFYHWNNAEIGSQYMCLRVPDTYNPKVHSFLNRFQV